MRTVVPYSVLASGYDEVMEHVDYELWADYIVGLIEYHEIPCDKILELGCGTGSLAENIVSQISTNYFGTDGSPEMVDVARSKLGERAAISVADFLDSQPSEDFELILILYDGINYLLSQDEIARLLDNVSDHLKPEGYLIFDLSTPFNSEINCDYFEDEGKTSKFSYLRRNDYRPETLIHQTTFEMTTAEGTFVEIHHQRPYSLNEVIPLLSSAGFDSCGIYSNMTMLPADDRTERIHWVVKKRGDL